MIDEPDIPQVVDPAASVAGSVSLVLWTTLARHLVDKGVLSHEEVRAMIKAAHEEFAREPDGGQAQALLARLQMNAA